MNAFDWFGLGMVASALLISGALLAVVLSMREEKKPVSRLEEKEPEEPQEESILAPHQYIPVEKPKSTEAPESMKRLLRGR